MSCPTCGAAAKHNETYDALYCPFCQVWLEPVCSRPTCRLCTDRPPNPPLPI